MDYIKEIIDIISNAYKNNSTDLTEQLKHYHEKDIADAYLELDKETQDYFRDHIDEQFLSDIFSYFAEENIDVIEELPTEEIADIVELMDVDDAKDVLDELDEDKQDEIKDLMEGEIKEDLKLIDSFEPEEIGSIMTTNYISVTTDLTIKEAMKEVVNQAGDNDNITTIVAVEKNDKFVGTIDIVDIIRGKQTESVETIVRHNTPYIYAHELISDSIEKLREYNLDITPVLDHGDHLLGVITSDDLVNIVDEELGEDYAKLAGLSEESDLDEPIRTSVKKRIPWLIILLLLGLGISVLISMFDVVIETVTAVMFFQSLILGMAGNVGTQSLAVTVRVISDTDLTKKESAKLIFKEVRVGFINGLVLATISFAAVFLFLVLKHEGIKEGMSFEMADALKMSISVSASLIAAMTLSSLFGTTVPMLLKKCKVDPATASGPFITTINDCIAVLCYYGLILILFYNLIFG
ncbi:MAG: magnesium transporter [Acholeplasmatales bacterium]|nr:magnesium transporter [Acholeplasmatales bacterium]